LAGYFVETSLPANPSEVETFAPTMFQFIVAVAKKLKQTGIELLEVGPVSDLTALQRWRVQDFAGDFFLLLQQITVAADLGDLFRDGTPLVRGCRGTGIANTDMPVFTDRNKYERVESTRKRFGLGTESLVDSTAAVFSQKNTGSIRPVIKAESTT
jgi:hypothetical protein